VSEDSCDDELVSYSDPTSKRCLPTSVRVGCGVNVPHSATLFYDASLTPEPFEEVTARYRAAISESPQDSILHLNYVYILHQVSPRAAAREFLLAQPYDDVPLARFGR
jgi:hypothetical protein